MREHEIDDRGMSPGDDALPGAPGAGENLCPECSGSGVTASGETCPNCEGTGRVIQGVGGA